MINTNIIPADEEPKEAEKPSLVLSIGCGTYPVILHFSTKSSPSLEEHIKQLIRQEVFSSPAGHKQKSSLPPNQGKRLGKTKGKYSYFAEYETDKDRLSVQFTPPYIEELKKVAAERAKSYIF